MRDPRANRKGLRLHGSDFEAIYSGDPVNTGLSGS